MANKPASERFRPVGDFFRSENCDGTFIDYPLPCCGDSGGETVPDPPNENDDACGKYNTYAAAIVDIISELQNQFAIQPNNNFGHDIAIGAAAYNKGLPLSPWVFDTRYFFRTENGTANYTEFNATQFLDSTVYANLVCIVKSTFEIGFGVFDYENFLTRMEAGGYRTHGIVITFIPLPRLKELIYQLAVGQPPLSDPEFTESDCDCGGTPPEAVDCDSPCAVTACHKIIPVPMSANEFLVTGSWEIIEFPQYNSGIWYGQNFNPLLIDMLVNRCVKKVHVISYTPCGVGQGPRSAHYRIEIDGVSVTDFKCSSLSRAEYLPCGEIGGFNGAGVIQFEFATPVLGRHVKVVPLREQINIVQVDIITCVD